MARSYRAVSAEIVGNLDSWKTYWSFLDDEPSASPTGAGVAGALVQGSDDFVIIELDGDAIVRVIDTEGSELSEWGPNDIGEIATAVGLRVA